MTDPTRSRRGLVRLALGLAALGALTMGGSRVDGAGPGRLVFTGTFTDSGTSEGIYAFRFDEATGVLTSVGLAAKTPSPAWIALHPNGRVLYAGNEVEDGFVSAFALNPATGALTLLNTRSAHGVRPCHVSIDPTGRALVVANYSSGTVALLPIQTDGRLGEATTVIRHTGSSIVTDRQAGPHAHQAVVDPSGRFVLVVDLGLDKVLVYRLDAAKGTLVAHDPPSSDTRKGAGPRHLAFSKDGMRAWVINELDNTISPFAWDAARGTLTPAGPSVRTLPGGYTGPSSTAEIEVHPSGRFLYGSNRGHDSLARFAIDASTGSLRPLDHTPIAGKAPRHFAIDPGGRWLLAAGQSSNTIAVFAIDPSDGRLTPSGAVTSTPTPVCILFAR
jgi:6-phosphogluconolactonase